MAAITHVCTIEHVAKVLGEDLEMLEAIVENDDNLNCGAIISIHFGSEKGITALTDDGRAIWIGVTVIFGRSTVISRWICCQRIRA